MGSIPCVVFYDWWDSFTGGFEEVEYHQLGSVLDAFSFPREDTQTKTSLCVLLPSRLRTVSVSWQTGWKCLLTPLHYLSDGQDGGWKTRSSWNKFATFPSYWFYDVRWNVRCNPLLPKRVRRGGCPGGTFGHKK